jgi:hypothetical protein
MGKQTVCTTGRCRLPLQTKGITSDEVTEQFAKMPKSMVDLPPPAETQVASANVSLISNPSSFRARMTSRPILSCRLKQDRNGLDPGRWQFKSAQKTMESSLFVLLENLKRK